MKATHLFLAYSRKPEKNEIFWKNMFCYLACIYRFSIDRSPFNDRSPPPPPLFLHWKHPTYTLYCNSCNFPSLSVSCKPSKRKFSVFSWAFIRIYWKIKANRLRKSCEPNRIIRGNKSGLRSLMQESGTHKIWHFSHITSNNKNIRTHAWYALKNPRRVKIKWNRNKHPTFIGGFAMLE